MSLTTCNGVQGWNFRFSLTKDWNRGLSEIRSLGFEAIDLISFAGFGFGEAPISRMPAKQVLESLQSHGVRCENCHFTYAELLARFADVMDYSHALGLKSIVAMPTFDRITTLDDWKWQAEQFNALGHKVVKEGFHPLGYHNHNFEFYPLPGGAGVKPYDVLMENTDPKCVKFQIDVGNLASTGSDPYAYFTKYLDRYFSLHAKDYKPGRSSVPVGKGIVDWKKILTIARGGSLENCFVEVGSYGLPRKGEKQMPWPKSENDMLRESHTYLQGLQV